MLDHGGALAVILLLSLGDESGDSCETTVFGSHGAFLSIYLSLSFPCGKFHMVTWPGSGGLTPYVIDSSFVEEDAEEEEEEETEPKHAEELPSVWEAGLRV